MIMGAVTAIGGIGHGVAEIIQGNKPALDIAARIGAFSVIPNYLITGIAAVCISVMILFWTIGFIHKRFGALVYLVLSAILFAVGGGVAHTLAIIITWLTATRINKPLVLWQKIIGPAKRKILARFWLPVMIAGYTFLFLGIGIWMIFTPPGRIYEISLYHYLCWGSLLLGFVFVLLSIVFGFARDIMLRDNAETGRLP
jgi:hypothetical protein